MELQQSKLKRRRWLAGFIICFLFAIIFLCVLLFTSFSSLEVTSENTVEYMATVKRVEKGDDNYLVFLDEYDFALVVANRNIIDFETLNTLNVGEEIYFRLRIVEVDLINSSSIKQIAVSALRTGQKDISTLDSYNYWLKKTDQKLDIIACSLTIIFFALSIVLLIIYIKRVKQSKNGEDQK